MLLLLTLKVPLWWTLFKPFFLKNILTLVTKGLEYYEREYYVYCRLFYGVWVWISPRNLLIQVTLTMIVMPTLCGTMHTVYSVLLHGTFVRMMINSSHGVQEHPNIPLSYKGRVKIEGRATLVIKNINPGENTKFKCEITGSFLYSVESVEQLIVEGMYYRLHH